MANESSDSDLSRSRSASPLSKHDSEGELNIQQLFFGDAFQYIENEGGADYIKKNNLHEINVDGDRKRDPAPPSDLGPGEEAKHPSNQSPSRGQNEYQTDLQARPQHKLSQEQLAQLKRRHRDAFRQVSDDSDDQNIGPENRAKKLMNELTLYRYKNEEEGDTRVLQFTNLFMPDTKKRRDLMESYNKNVINPFVGFGGENVREEKRRLKQNYKECMAMHAHKAKYLSVNMFMEDFFYLQGYSNKGAAKKAIQNPNYKPLFGLQQNTQIHHNVERIVPKRKRKAAPEPQLLRQQLVKKQSETANEQVVSDMNGSTEANSERQFALESCQINELQTKILPFRKDNDEKELRNKFQVAKETISLTMRQKYPLAAFTPIEKQCYSYLWQMYKSYQDTQNTGRSGGWPMQQRQMREHEPDDYQLQEWVTQQKFAVAGIPQKRVKYWGELTNCSSEYQLLKDRIQIKRAEWQQFCKDKKAYKAPVFRIKTQSPSQTQQAGQKGKDDKLSKVNSAQANSTAASSSIQNSQSQPKGILKPTEQSGKPSKDKESELQKQQNPSDVRAHEMVTNFEEYQLLKKKESMQYCQRKKTNVTAASIMRHVKWKLGQMSDKQFYREEYEEELANRMGQRSQRSILQAKMNDVEFKDTESVKIVKDGPLEFEENFDTHFNRRRIEIQERILRMKEKKEKNNQQNQKPLTTTAYEPCPINSKPPGENSEQENRHGERSNSSNGDDDTSSSDTDSEVDDGQDQARKRDENRVLSSVGDELNHAKCIQDMSYYKLDWSKEDLDTFHRPNIQISFGGAGSHLPMRVVSSKKDEQERMNLNPQNYFKKRSKLSVKKGKFCIFEHIDQHPLFINNFGMASRLKRYFYGTKRPLKKVFKTNAENKETRHIGPLGELILKGVHDKLELLGQVDRKAYKGISLLENKLYNVPVFYHKPHRVDFFCAIHKQEDSQGQPGPQSIFIRELEQVYTVGQIEPKLEVYNPQSRHFQNFIKQRSKSYVIRFLEEADNNTINFQDIVRFFPQIGEPILKKGLKEIEVLVDRDGRCKFDKKFDIEKQVGRMTPENICQYESARHGQHRLEKIGITEILSADKISYSTNKFCFEETDLTLQRVAKLIESEVLQTPWNLSTNFIKIKQEMSMMMLQGQGDPSYGCGGYSFLKMPLKISADSLAGARQNRMNLNPAIQNPKAVTGTEADLRKLQKDDIYEKLVKLGVSREVLDNKTRWQMVALLRWYAPNQDENKQYARGVRNTSKKQQEMYTERANQTFKKQMDNLSEYGIPKYTHAFSEDEPNFSNELNTRDYSQSPKKSGGGIHGKNKKKEADGKREPGANATDFAKEIHEMMNDETKKLVVEVKTMNPITKLEDIKDYLKLLLVRTPPTALAPQNQNPSIGINIGQVSTNAELYDAMNGNGSKDLEKMLLEKIQQRELTKKCEILCKKIRSLTLMNNPDIDPEEKKKYQRIIFCADEKTIKKFNRCKNKNQQKIPRTNKKTRVNERVKSRNQLTAENLQKTSRANSKKGSSVTGSRMRDDEKESISESMLSSSRMRAGNKVVLPRNSSFSSAKKKSQKRAQPAFSSQLKLKVTNTGQFPQNAESQGSLIEPPGGLALAGGPLIKIPVSVTPPVTSYNRPKAQTTGSKANNSQFTSKFNYTMDDDDDDDQEDNSESDYEYNKVPPFRKTKVMFAQEPPTIIRKKTNTSKLKRTTSNAARFKSHGFSNNDFEFSNSYQNKSSRKRQQASDQALNQIFSEIIQQLWDRDFRGWFHNQVSRQDAPNYKEKIKVPIALKDMKNKTKRSEYKNRQQFLNDVVLMRMNAETFNGVDNPIAQIARELEELAKTEVEKKHDEIVNLETLVQETTSTALMI